MKDDQKISLLDFFYFQEHIAYEVDTVLFHKPPIGSRNSVTVRQVLLYLLST